MARPKGSKNKQGTDNTAGVVTIQLSEEVILRSLTAEQLLRLATRKFAEGQRTSSPAAEDSGAAPRGQKKRRRFSPEARRKMAEAQKRRWAKRKGKAS